MKKQKGEVVTGVVVLMMVGMMLLLGMVSMHGGHEDRKEHTMSDQQGHSGTTQHHMHQGDAENTQQPAADEKK
jgi:hypothetical protein